MEENQRLQGFRREATKILLDNLFGGKRVTTIMYEAKEAYVEGLDGVQTFDFTEEEIGLLVQKMVDSHQLSKLKRSVKKTGFKFNGVQVSLTKEDALGLLLAKEAIASGVENTVMEFSNGATIKVDATLLAELTKQTLTARNEFFMGYNLKEMTAKANKIQNSDTFTQGHSSTIQKNI